jgi:hypothetical protein
VARDQHGVRDSVSVSVTRSVLRLRAECLACEPMCKGDTSEYWFKSARDCTCGCLCARLCVFSVPLRVLLRMALPASVHVCAHMKVCTGPVFSIRCTSQRLQLPWATLESSGSRRLDCPAGFPALGHLTVTPPPLGSCLKVGWQEPCLLLLSLFLLEKAGPQGRRAGRGRRILYWTGIFHCK